MIDLHKHTHKRLKKSLLSKKIFSLWTSVAGARESLSCVDLAAIAGAPCRWWCSVLSHGSMPVAAGSPCCEPCWWLHDMLSQGSGAALVGVPHWKLCWWHHSTLSHSSTVVVADFPCCKTYWQCGSIQSCSHQGLRYLKKKKVPAWAHFVSVWQCQFTSWGWGRAKSPMLWSNRGTGRKSPAAKGRLQSRQRSQEGQLVAACEWGATPHFPLGWLGGVSSLTWRGIIVLS